MRDERMREQIAAYLRRVDRELRDIPPAQRREILDDLRAHIDEALAAGTAPSEAALRTILDRLGQPEDLAREARERLGMPTVEEWVPTRPGGLEIAAVALTVLCWPVGIVLAWLSSRWRTRDKVIATVLPLLGFALVVAWFTPFGYGSSGSVGGPAAATAVVIQDPVAMPPAPAPTEVMPAPAEGQPKPTGAVAAVVSLLMLVFGSSGGMALVAAIYLAIRLRRTAVRPAVVIGLEAAP